MAQSKAMAPSAAAGTDGGAWYDVRQVVANFSGRETEIEIIHKMLTRPNNNNNSSNMVVSITGPAGIGKSSLASKYAFKYADFYAGNVIWVNAGSADSMRESLVRLAKGLGLAFGDQCPNELLIEKVVQYFEVRGERFLLILDNLEDKCEKSQFKLLQQQQPQPQLHNPCAHVLVTSRREGLNPNPPYPACAAANEFHLHGLTVSEAVQLIQKSVQVSRESALRLADRLQRLPLALQQAVSYLQDGISGDKEQEQDEAVASYLRQFDRFRDQVQYFKPTFATWQTALIKIQEMGSGKCKFAIRICNVLAYLNPDCISLQFIRTVFRGEEEESGLELLQKFSLVQVTECGRVFIHRLVQSAVRLTINGQEECEIIRLITTTIRARLQTSTFNDLTRESASHGLHLFPYQVNHPDELRERGAYYGLLDVCYYLLMYGCVEDCLAVAQQAASLFEVVNGAGHESTITMRWMVADARRFLEKYSMARR